MPFQTNIDSSTLPETQQQLLNEILKVLSMPSIPYVFPAYIGLPPYQETKNDLLYQILMKLSGGGAGGNVFYNKLEIRPTDPPNTLYHLPAKCLITDVIIKTENNGTLRLYASDLGGVEPDVDIVSEQTYISGQRETTASTIEIVHATEVKGSGTALGLPTLWIDIFYTTTTI